MGNVHQLANDEMIGHDGIDVGKETSTGWE